MGESVHGIADGLNPRPGFCGSSNAIDHGGVVRGLRFPVGLDVFRRGRGCCHGRDVGEATDPSAVGSLVRSPTNVGRDNQHRAARRPTPVTRSGDQDVPGVADGPMAGYLNGFADHRNPRLPTQSVNFLHRLHGADFGIGLLNADQSRAITDRGGECVGVDAAERIDRDGDGFDAGAGAGREGHGHGFGRTNEDAGRGSGGESGLVEPHNGRPQDIGPGASDETGRHWHAQKASDRCARGIENQPCATALVVQPSRVGPALLESCDQGPGCDGKYGLTPDGIEVASQRCRPRVRPDLACFSGGGRCLRIGHSRTLAGVVDVTLHPLFSPSPRGVRGCSVR